jgi:uncharacterized alkaline shock family protein YloU
MSDKNVAINTEETTTLKTESNGTISFANEVISTIAGLAAVDIEGVAGMSGGLVDGITEFLGRKNFSKGIKVEVGKEEVAVDINIIVYYGIAIPEVCQNIQQSVVKAIETMTGLRVVEVNIGIQGVVFKDEPTPEPPEEEVPEKKPSKPEKAKRVK